jgi:hypothetical protein
LFCDATRKRLGAGLECGTVGTCSGRRLVTGIWRTIGLGQVPRLSSWPVSDRRFAEWSASA